MQSPSQSQPNPPTPTLTTQSTQILQCPSSSPTSPSSPSSPTLLLNYSISSSNIITFYSTHIQFRNGRLNYDRNSVAYAVRFSSDGRYGFVFLGSPDGLEVVAMADGGVIVARGLGEIREWNVVGVAMQGLEELKPGQQSRRIYLLLQNKGSILLKVIQVQPDIDPNPKTRQKPLQQHSSSFSSLSSSSSLSLRPLPTFSTTRWNIFLSLTQNSLQICRPRNKNDDIEIEFASQNMQKNLMELYVNNVVMAMAETAKTWALLCGYRTGGMDGGEMVVNVFWQHYFGNDLTKNMYYRDDSFLKTVVLPCQKRDFVRMWQFNGFYAIETKGTEVGSHRCYLVSECDWIEGLGTDLFVMSLSDNSAVCQQSIVANQSEISICEIVNKNRLNRIKLYAKQQTQQTLPPPSQSTNSQQTSSNTHSNNPNNQISDKRESEKTQSTTNTTQTIQSNQTALTNKTEGNKNQGQENIKKFQPLPEPATQQVGKVTVKKQDNLATENLPKQQPKNLINSKLLQHLDKGEGQSNQSQSIQVPNSVQKLASFGVPGQIKSKPKQQKPSNVLMSFGAPMKNETKQQKPNTMLMSFGQKIPQKNSPKQPKQVKPTSTPTPKPPSTSTLSLTPTQLSQTLQLFTNLTKSFQSEIHQKTLSFTQNYQPTSLTTTITESLKFQPIFTQRQQLRLKYLQRWSNQVVANLRRKQEEEERRFGEVVGRVRKIGGRLGRVGEMGIWGSQGLGLGFIRRDKVRKRVKEISEIMEQKLQELNQKISNLQVTIQQKMLIYSETSSIKSESASNPPPTQKPPKTKQIFSHLHKPPKKPPLQKTPKIPPFHQILYHKTDPLYKLSQL